MTAANGHLRQAEGGRADYGQLRAVPAHRLWSGLTGSGPGRVPLPFREVCADRRSCDLMPRRPGVGSDFWKSGWPLQGGVGQLEEDRARKEGIAKVTPELSKRFRDEDRTVAFPDVSVRVTGMAMSEPAELLVQGTQDTVWVPAE